MESWEQSESTGDGMDIPIGSALYADQSRDEEHVGEEAYLEEDILQQSAGLPPQPGGLSQPPVGSSDQTLKRKRILLADQILSASQQLGTDGEQIEMTLKMVSKAFSGLVLKKVICEIIYHDLYSFTFLIGMIFVCVQCASLQNIKSGPIFELRRI